jgi:DNA-binding Lrp family transcriptional regulator
MADYEKEELLIRAINKNIATSQAKLAKKLCIWPKTFRNHTRRMIQEKKIVCLHQGKGKAYSYMVR